MTSNDGNCPACKGRNWKTLEALSLTQQTRTTYTTTSGGNRHRETTVDRRSQAALQHAAPVKPVDHDQHARFRQGCHDAVAAARNKLDEIDAACGNPAQALPGMFNRGPEANRATFDHYARADERIVSYDIELATWRATKLCLRCAATFIDAGFQAPRPPPLAFRFAGQERRCTACDSYFWKDPAAVAAQWETSAHARFAVAFKARRDAQAAEDEANTKSGQSGFWHRVASYLSFGQQSVADAQASLTKAELAHASEMRVVAALRDCLEKDASTRWCVACKCTYTNG